MYFIYCEQFFFSLKIFFWLDQIHRMYPFSFSFGFLSFMGRVVSFSFVFQDGFGREGSSGE
jgi:hypothetical protein